MTDEPYEVPLRRGLRAAALVVACAAVLGLGLANLLRSLHRYPVPEAQFVSWGVLAGLLVAEGVLTVRGRPWGRAAPYAVAAVLGASALSYVTLPDHSAATGTDWVFGAAGWAGMVVLMGRGPRAVIGFLLAHEVLELASLIFLDEPTRGRLLSFATGSVSVLGYPLCVLVLTTVLHRIGMRTAAASAELERLRTADAVAEESHRRRRRRMEELDATTFPLLEGLADGTLDPEDPAVRRRCAIDAARMRRLFGETDAGEDPLLHELRHCADIADRKGVEVELEASGRGPEPPVEVRHALTEPALAVLATARTRARITVAGEPGLVSVSVVADCPEIEPTGHAASPGQAAARSPEPAGAVRTSTFRAGETVWMEAEWRAS